MSDVLQLASLLLQYPDDELLAARGQVAAVVARLERGGARECLERFCAWWSEAAPLALQATYVDTFDTDRRCSLHLTYPVHGDRRERGMTLLRLKRRYAAAGMDLGATELPDFLPVMLEFAASAADGIALLDEQRSAIELLAAELRRRDSPYVNVVDAVRRCLPGVTRHQLEAFRRLARAEPPSELVGLEPFAPPEAIAAAATEPRR